MKKKFAVIFFSFILILSITGCTINRNDSDSSSKASVSNLSNEFLMWQVTKDGYTGQFYLLGSIHAAKDDIYPMPEKVQKAYNNCDNIAVECNVVKAENNLTKDFQKSYEYSLAYMYADGTKIYDHIDKNIYEGAKKILKDNTLYISAFDKMTPAFWSSMLDQVLIEKCGLDTKQGIDRHFINSAEKDNKNILEIESFEFQNELLNNFSDKTYEILIESYVENNMDEITAQLLDLYDAVITGDLEKAQEANETDYSDLTEEEVELMKDYDKKLLSDRNITMTQKAEEYIAKNKSVLYIVGAAHMLGDDGIVKLLQNNGYTVIRY